MLTPINPDDMPNGEEAVEIYNSVYHGRITRETSFGYDPLSHSSKLQEEREQNFLALYDIANIFSECVNERSRLFEDALLYFINITLDLCNRD